MRNAFLWPLSIFIHPKISYSPRHIGYGSCQEHSQRNKIKKTNPKNKTEFVYLFKVIRNMQNSMLLLINVQQIEAQTIKRTRAQTKSTRNENKYFAKKLDKTETRQKKNTACTLYIFNILNN